MAHRMADNRLTMTLRDGDSLRVRSVRIRRRARIRIHERCERISGRCCCCWWCWSLDRERSSRCTSVLLLDGTRRARAMRFRQRRQILTVLQVCLFHFQLVQCILSLHIQTTTLLVSLSCKKNRACNNTVVSDNECKQSIRARWLCCPLSTDVVSAVHSSSHTHQ